MKVLLITLLFVAAVSARVVVEQEPRVEGPACPLPDVLEFVEGYINITLQPILTIDEESIQRGGVALGLNTLYYKYTINYILLTVTFEVSIAKASVAGDSYDATGSINLEPFSEAVFPAGDFVGTGAYAGEIVELEVQGSATILVDLISNRIRLSRLKINTLSFASLSLDLGTFQIGAEGTLVDFPQWSSTIKVTWDKEFPEVGDDFVQIIRTEIINPYLGQYTLAEFLEIIGGGEGATPAPCVTEAPTAAP